mmetsp:Transcript_38027/g.95268  ORF Transcript_38027/g.95268 Transcript_38027/m.95268 type:complete len:200 (+) Transcript_38027:1111-1710(+)
MGAKSRSLGTLKPSMYSPMCWPVWVMRRSCSGGSSPTSWGVSRELATSQAASLCSSMWPYRSNNGSNTGCSLRILVSKTTSAKASKHRFSAKASASSCTSRASCRIHTSKICPELPPVLSIDAPSARPFITSRFASSRDTLTGPSPAPVSASPFRFFQPFCTPSSSSLATFCHSTRLSPSAVMPACAPVMASPKRLQAR